MSQKNHPIYNLKPWECWYEVDDAEGDLFWRNWQRVPGGWIVSEGDTGVNVATTSVFVPYNEEFMKELR